MRKNVWIVAALLLLPAWASEPGEPLDCSDWVFVEPGLNCSDSVPPSDTRFLNVAAGPAAANNEGHLIDVDRDFFLPACGSNPLMRVSVVQWDGQVERTLAYVDERCVDPVLGKVDRFLPRAGGPIDTYRFTFDAVNGRILVPVEARCDEAGQSSCQEGHYGSVKIAEIGGLTTLFEVLQTYDPGINELSFRVPYMPEGFEDADWFDTYWGDLATVGDWSKAQGLQCMYPNTPPNVGDYLTVLDTLPDPAPGTGRYYVTAVTHMGQRRYGRKAEGGQLSGRDPAVLPGCSE